MPISEAQSLFLRMLELTTFNTLDGLRVARDLRENEEAWRSFMFTRVGPLALIGLRELASGHLGYDTLFILAAPSRQGRLEELAGTWSADEVDWIGAEEARRFLGSRHAVADFAKDPEKVVMRVWWD